MNTFRRITTPALALLAALGCSNGSAHTQAVDESVAGRLVGTWDITFVLERPLSLSTDARKLPRSVAGTLALLERGTEPLSFEQMSAPTHMGVFHVDIGALGFPPSETGVPDLVARVVASSQRSTAAQERDSVYIVLNPETPRYAVRLSGRFDAHDATGTWIAESFLGGGGTFVMRRR
jgi:hypothetical protein